MKPFLLLLFSIVVSLSCQSVQAQSNAMKERSTHDIMNDLKLKSLSGVDSMKREFQRGMAEMQRNLNEVKVTPDGKVTAGQTTIDVGKQVQKLSDGVAALGKIFEIPAADLQQAQTAIQSMPQLLEQGVELLKNMDIFNTETK
jgi:hypothetical protein